MEIILNDLLQFKKEEFGNIKVKFNQFNGVDDPLEIYQKDPEKVNTQWLFWRNQQGYFYEGQIALCFLKLSVDTWLLTTIKKITKDLKINGGISYEGYQLPEYEKYYGRVIVKYHKPRQQGMYYERVCEEMVVNQILPVTFDGFDFSGYDNVRLSYCQLENIINQHKKDWISALENQKAVYLITDTKNGKHYVGSATSDCGMLLQRWSRYIADGHGGNVDLVTLVQEKGFDYVKKYFQYSILENYNGKVDDSTILKRESWWKETLKSRTFGYNGN